MAQYRVYKLGRDGHFTGFEALVCADDAAAIEQAKGFVGQDGVELWSGTRMVVRLDRDPKIK
jgi:hypothetical protein